MQLKQFITRVFKAFLIIMVLFIENTCLGNDITSQSIKYYRWAMIERQDRKPLFSATTTLKHIYNPESKHEKNFYKAVYTDKNILSVVSTYEKDKLVRIDYFSETGLWKRFSKYKDNEEIKCHINFETVEKKYKKHTITCEDKSLREVTYHYKEWNDEQKRLLNKPLDEESGVWGVYQILEYENNIRVFKRIVIDSTCFDYDENDTLEKKECTSTYEDTKPMDHAVWSMVPMW
ncbi:MAG TPA: hypothetical protein ENK66_03280 [Arcobacter sp.]|nr:hypothetical protein [Arcobacter sp.]